MKAFGFSLPATKKPLAKGKDVVISDAQEVYGAGNAFGILPRHYLRVPEQDFMVYVDYPTSNFTAQKNKPINFNVLGDSRFECRLVLVKMSRSKLPDVEIKLKGTKEHLKGKTVEREI